MVADEDAHFLRAYQVSEGGLVSYKSPDGTSCGGLLPQSLADAIANMPVGVIFHPEVKYDTSYIFASLRKPLNLGRRSFLDFKNTALYSPVPYLPQALGIAVGRAFGLPAVALMYCGRIANLFICMNLLTLAIRIFPVQRWALSLSVLVPMSLFQLASLSADGPTIALAFIYIAMVWRLALIKDQLPTRPYIITLTIIGVALALTKTAYLPVVGLILVVPSHKYPTGLLRKIKVSAAILGASVATVGIWTIVAKSLYIPKLSDVNPDLQMAFVREHPGDFLNALGNTVRVYGIAHFSQMFGKFLGWLDAKIPYVYLRPIILGILVLAISESPVDALPQWWARVWSWLLWIATGVLTGLLLFLSWTKIGANLIEGIQGRYFLPILPLFLIPLVNASIGNKLRGLNILPFLTVILGIYAGVVTTVFVYARYYVS